MNHQHIPEVGRDDFFFFFVEFNKKSKVETSY